MERIKDTEMRNIGNDIEKVYAFLDGVSNDSEWINPIEHDCGVVHFPRNIVNVMNVDENNVHECFLERESGKKYPTEGINLNEEIVQECMEERALFLIVPGEKRYRVLPLESTGRAFRHLLNRGGDLCRIMTTEVKTSSVTPLDPEKRARRINEDFQLNHTPMYVLVRWGKVDAVMSKDYVILDAKELLKECVSALEEKYDVVNLASSTWDHEFFNVRFDVKDDLFAEEIKDSLNKLGINANEVEVKFFFYTSDVGMASATGRVYLTVDGQDVFLPGGAKNGIDTRHYGGTSIGLFKESLREYLQNAGELDIEKIEKLGNTPVKDITETMKDIQTKFDSVLPKALTEAVVAEYVLKNGNAGTAIDCYVCANTVAGRSIAQKGGHTRDAVNAMNALVKIATYFVR